MNERPIEETKEYIRNLVESSRKAQKFFEHNYKKQHDIDAVVRAAGRGVVDNCEMLAEEAISETGMGDLQAKRDKMNGIALAQWNMVKGKQTVGFMDVPDEPGVRMMYKPLGVIGCVMPSTNPVATVIGNTMMALKGRNSVIVAPHPRSAETSYITCEMIRKALEESGAPKDLVLCISPEMSSIDATKILLGECDCNIATGGAKMVKSVYSAGKPAFGVGQGNCQAIIDRDLPEELEDYDTIAATIIDNRSWDNGVPCTGEQTVHVPVERESDFIEMAKKNGAYLIENETDVDALRNILFPEGGPINRRVVGKSTYEIGKMAGIAVPEDAIVILVKNQHSGSEDPLCREILCPVLRYRTYSDFEEAVAAAVANLEEEGAGHSSSIWTNNDERVAYAADLIPVGRFHINQPTTGARNGIPSTITIGCGSWGNNSISENLEYYHLLNKTRVSVPLENYRPIDFEHDWDDWDPVSRVIE